MARPFTNKVETSWKKCTDPWWAELDQLHSMTLAHPPNFGRGSWRFVMARRSGSSRTFRNDPQLQQYFLEGVAPTGKTLGVGSYGSVVEVK